MENRVRVSRWEEIPEVIREKLIDQVVEQIATLVTSPMLENYSSLVEASAYSQWIWDCAQAMRQKILREGLT